MRGQDSYINQKLIGHGMRYPRISIVLRYCLEKRKKKLLFETEMIRIYRNNL